MRLFSAAIVFLVSFALFSAYYEWVRQEPVRQVQGGIVQPTPQEPIGTIEKITSKDDVDEPAPIWKIK